jgi:hypothetical protein
LVGAGDYGLGDGDELVLLAENAEARDRRGVAIELRGGAGRQLHAAGLDLRHEDGELGAVADAFFQHGKNISARIIRQQIFQGDKAGLEFAFASGIGQFFHFDGLIEREFADGGAADFGEMRAATEFLTHVVSERTNVGARGALDGEAGKRAIDIEETIFEELDGDGVEFDSLIFAGEFVGRAAMDFFGGENGRHLFEAADGFGGETLEKLAIENRRRVGSLRGAFGIVGVRGIAEAKARGVAFAASGIEAHQAGGFAEEQDENAGGKRIESAEVADLPEARKMADGVDDVVGSSALRFVDDERAVEGGGLGQAWHGIVVSYKLSVFGRKSYVEAAEEREVRLEEQIGVTGVWKVSCQ